MYEILDWKDVEEGIHDLAKKLKEYSFDVMIAISKGGLIPGRLLYDVLQSKAKFAVISIKFYEDVERTLPYPILEAPIAVDIVNKNVFVVDDVADSGRSLRLALHTLKEMGAREISSAVLFLKPTSVVTPTYVWKETSNWVVFPWEVHTTQNVRRCVCQS